MLFIGETWLLASAASPSLRFSYAPRIRLDHERVVGDVGKAGVAVDSILDMNILLTGFRSTKCRCR